MEVAIQGYKDDITGFTEQVQAQQERIQGLEEIKNQLEADIANCPDATETANLLNVQFTESMKSNNELKVNSDVLKDTRILQRLDRGNLKERQ